MTALLTLALLLLVSPALAATRCTTYQEKTLGRLQTLCANGMRAVSTSHAGWPATATSRQRGAPHHE